MTANKRSRTLLATAALWFCSVPCTNAAAPATTQSSETSQNDSKTITTLDTEEMVVVGAIERSVNQASAVQAIDAATITLTHAEHVHEVLVRLPGVLVSRGSGQEHLTAIRSEVVTGAGSCGAFQFLEDGIPLRPHGFCNVNGLFEATAELSGRIEALRGPASALFGGNALHGVLNFTAPAVSNDGLRIATELGRWDFGQLRVTYDAAPWRIDLLGTSTNGYRDDTGFGEQKMLLQQQSDWRNWSVHNQLTITNLNQETGGFVVGEDAYESSRLRDTNPNPEAFRDAWSVRASSDWRNNEWRMTFYGRTSNMEFLQHFSPGQPLERTGQSSGGIFLGYEVNAWLALGANVEVARGDVFEFQNRPAVGTPAVVATRPLGTHYDYEVDSQAAAVFYNVNYPVGGQNQWYLIHSGRLEYLNYDYDNLALDGNTRDDGTTCGFGGCLFNRPADREDDYTNLAGRLGIRRVWDELSLYAVVGRGFRPPQTGELYRLQRGQNVADLDDEVLDSLEIGVNILRSSVTLDLAIYAQRKRHFILRDALGFNVSDGRTKSEGAEIAGQWQINERHSLDLAVTYSRHRYDFDRNIAGGEIIREGNDADTAPRWLGAAHWKYAPLPNWLAELEVVHQGDYYVDAANSADYPGHTLVNLRGRWQATEDITLTTRVMNLLNEDYADRADIAFGNFRYFPGEPLRAFVGFEWTL